MNFFVDTNIPYGYTVIHDEWHDKASNFIDNNPNSIFWSNNVENEYNGLLNDTLDEVNVFFKIVGDILRNKDNTFLNYYNFEEYILHRTKLCKLDTDKKRKILEHFWNNKNIIEGIPVIINMKLEEFAANFNALYLQRDKKLRKTLILHDCGLDNFKKYLEYANQLYEWGVHKPDCKIITDAHDCGLKHGNLIFVSTDNKMLNKILEHDHSFLRIMEFRSCN